MENLVFNNLESSYYWQNYGDKEIDFVIRNQEITTKLIQVSYITSQSDIKSREIDNLVLGSKTLQCHDLSLVTWDLQDTIRHNTDTIKLVPISHYLLGLKL